MSREISGAALVELLGRCRFKEASRLKHGTVFETDWGEVRSEYLVVDVDETDTSPAHDLDLVIWYLEESAGVPRDYLYDCLAQMGIDPPDR